MLDRRNCSAAVQLQQLEGVSYRPSHATCHEVLADGISTFAREDEEVVDLDRPSSFLPENDRGSQDTVRSVSGNRGDWELGVS